jgi:hypothetical protein
MYNQAVLPYSTAAILINGWCKEEHLNGYFMFDGFNRSKIRWLRSFFNTLLKVFL